MTNQEKYDDFRIKIVDLIDENRENLTPKDVVWALIETAVSCALSCAPTEMDGIKVILECVQMGITAYEQSAS